MGGIFIATTYGNVHEKTTYWDNDWDIPTAWAIAIVLQHMAMSQNPGTA